MFRNYLLTAARNLAKHKLYSLINIVGLSIGLTAAFLIALFLRDELSYDKWIPGSSNVYRTEVNIAIPNRPLLKLALSPFALPQVMADRIPEVHAMTRLVLEMMNVASGDRHFYETVDVVDPNFFQVIRLPFVQGNPTTVLAQTESIVVSERIAKKYFGDENPLGRTLTIGGTADSRGISADAHLVTVTGVIRDAPHNTQLIADMFLSNLSVMDQMSQATKADWTSQKGYGYVELAPSAAPAVVIQKLRQIIDQSIDPMKIVGKRMRGSEFEQPQLTPFQSDHLTTDNNFGAMRPPGSWTTIEGLAIIAFLILLVASFNFMNLATARATLRAREISMRKVVGAERRQLVIQFLGEAVLTALLALVIALSLLEILLPLYSQFLGRPIAFDYVSDWRVVLALLCTAIAVGLISGAYPALVLSSFRPAATLKASASGMSGSVLIRMGFVGLQFTVSICLGIVAIVVFRELSFARHSDLGFDRDGIVVIATGGHLTLSARTSMVHALSSTSVVRAVAQSSVVPFMTTYTNGSIQKPGESAILIFRTMDISPDFPDAYAMPVAAGRTLSMSRGEDVLLVNPFAPNSENSGTSRSDRNILLNVAAAHRLGWSHAEAIGKSLVFDGMQVNVVGILGDPKIDGLKAPVLPMVFAYAPDSNTYISVRIRQSDIPSALAEIDRTWASFAPGVPIQRFFLEDSFNRLFQADEKLGTMVDVFTGVAIAIASLGLFGLAAFTAQRRTKEIGIRKVFGARNSDVVRLLLWQFSIPVILANLIAWPLAYSYLHRWLEGYADPIPLSPLYFFGAGTAALAAAWTTVIVHALRVARSKPIFALRYE